MKLFIGLVYMGGLVYWQAAFQRDLEGANLEIITLRYR